MEFVHFSVLQIFLLILSFYFVVGNIKNGCIEKSLEAREEEARIVVTATVKNLMLDTKHPGMVMGEVEIKRVFKGGAILNNFIKPTRNRIRHRRLHQRIQVEGFRDPKICDSDIRRSDTRILLLNENGDGHLKLNSSVLRINMINLDYTSAVVKDVPFEPPKAEEQTSCGNYFCAFYGECYIDKVSNGPACRCPLHPCPNDHTPVCGDDGMTYRTQCHLERSSCKEQRRIKNKHPGECKGKEPVHGGWSSWGDWSPCSVSCGAGKKRRFRDCKNPAPSPSGRYCGDSWMQEDNCFIECDPCAGFSCPYPQACMLDAKRQPTCRCNTVCPDEVNMVCGSNGHTYSNQCWLEREACRSQTDLKVLHPGRCKDLFTKSILDEDNPCKLIKCDYGEVCRIDHEGKGHCECPPSCQLVINKVCGTDDVTYDNECELRRRACQNKTVVDIKHLGACGGEHCKTRCGHGARCVKQNGVETCVCPHKCQDGYFEPVCGSDGKTYKNFCRLQEYNCHQKTNIIKEHDGLCNGCGKQETCEHYSFCYRSGNSAKCVCPTCEENTVAKVCGSDGRTYDNECKLRKTSCMNSTFITVASDGECVKDPYNAMCRRRRCKFGEICRNDHCVCPRSCPLYGDPICGSNGKTYRNKCEMMKDGCRQRVDLTIQHNGRCEETCDPSIQCPETVRMVCANNGKTYINECTMKKEACRLNTNLQIVDLGSCEDEREGSTSGGVCTCNRYGTIDNTCHPNTNKCECKHGVGGAKCNLCLPGYWNLKGINGCLRCECNRYGSTRTDCEQSTGQCQCRHGMTGLKCDKCTNGLQIGINGCDIYGVSIQGTCMELVCGFGGECKEQNGRAYCDCSNLPCLPKDHKNSAVVCGSDGRTYQSECQLHLTSCEQQTHLYMHHLAPCHNANRKTTAPMHPNRLSRKTTKHTDDGEADVTRSTEKPKGQTGPRSSPIVKILDRCLNGDYCSAGNSQCRQGICQCKQGYMSSSDLKECVEVKTLPLDEHVTDDSCINNPCRNNGLCRLDKDLGYRCLCPIGRSGSICKDNGRITTPSFSGMSQLILRHYIQTDHEIIIDISFKALNYDGLLLFSSQFPNGSGDFLSLSLRDAYVEFRFDVGGGPMILRNRHRIQLNQFIHVTASRDGKDGSLTVDKEAPVLGTAPGSLVSLNLVDRPFYLGNPQSEIDKEFKQRLPMGFVGCIKTFHVKNKLRTHLYDLSYPQVSDHIMSGLDIAECGSNSCNSLPCKYGGTCLAKDSDVYSCVCKHGFTGRDCEIVLDPCVMANCHESSTCQIYGNSYKCICSSNREGEFCEFEKLQPIDVPEFSGNSFLELPLGDIGSTAMTFTIWFKTSKPNGVLFYASTYAGGNGDFISLNIVDRRVEFRFNMGSGTIVISSDAVISLDTWHEVMIDKTKKFGILLIDKNPQYNYTGESKGFLTELNLDNSILYLGGFKSRFDIPVDSNITYNLTGVIQRMYINGKLYDDLMLSAKDKINVLPYRGAPCNVNPCLNGGVCIPKMDQVECKCPAKFIGVKCEKRVDSVNRDRPLLFDGETYLQYSNEISEESAAQRSNKYYIKFRTLKSNGLILYQNGKSNVLGDYLAIAIVRGRVEFSYNLGKQSEKDLHIIRSSVDIDDGGWHKILAERHEREGTLKVDNEKLITDSSTEGASQLDTNGILLIGGKTRVNIELPEDYNQGFMGCIQQVLVNDRELHLVQHRRTSSAVNFCDAR
ncbi:agrin-like isoform X7 [Mytilus galloprovincialis]|uniref:agrin-like isoform X7 n=1 Tax=Mytilus galloprovincialis TaxID=29158 RepID=UPI003F7CB791